MLKLLLQKLKGTATIFCKKCGWQTQKTKTTEKLKKHCNNCNCTK